LLTLAAAWLSLAVPCLQCAIAIDGRNPLARFEAAGVLAAMERHQEALTELQALQVNGCSVLSSLFWG
jgi:hypothetical protein